MNLHKPCRVCRQSYPASLECFNRRSKERDGLNTVCKTCSRKMARDFYQEKPEMGRSYRKRNTEKVRQREQRYWETHRKLKQAKDRRYRDKYPSLNKERCSRRYAADPAKHAVGVMDWRRRNPEKVAGYVRKANFRRRQVPMDKVAREYVKVLRRDPCVYCGVRTLRQVIDHIVPVARGGTSRWDNLASACTSCNARKCHKEMLKFFIGRQAI